MDLNKKQIKIGSGHNINKTKIFLLIIGAIFLISGFSYAFFGGDTTRNQTTTTTPNTVPALKGKLNILVLGVDERADDIGRSDTTFVVMVDANAKKVTTLSVPRDTRVKIAGHGWDKINHAYSFGGSPLSKTAVETLIGVPIDYTVVINLRGFVQMIDAIGGVTLDVEKRMSYSDPYDDNGGLEIDLRPGVQRLNGQTAVEYVRYRDEEGDIGRVARQQKFLKAVMEEFSKPQIITKLPALIKEFSSAVRTDMPTKEMVKLIPVLNDAAKTGLDTEAVTGTPLWIQEVSYWSPDIKDLRAKIAQAQGLMLDERFTQSTTRLIDEYKQSVPAESKVAQGSLNGSRNSEADKKNATTKTTPTSPAPTTPVVPNKPKVENGSANVKISPETKSPPPPPTATPRTSEPTDTSNGAVKIKPIAEQGTKP